MGGRKSGHLSIVAPLAATVAATVAVGVGVVLAKAGRDRRQARQRLIDRELGLLPDERLARGLQRMALGQLDLAIEQLGGSGERVVGEAAVHETRKALKRLRALVRLLRRELGASTFARESDGLSRIAGDLAGARDSEVMLCTLDELIRRSPRKLGRRKGVKRLRRSLADEHQRAASRALGDPAKRAEALAELRAARDRVAAWDLPENRGIGLVERDLLKIYRQGRGRYRRVAHGRGDRVTAMHEWRKRVKDLRYIAEMLQRREATGKGRRRRKSERRAAERLRKLARRADALGELLGEDHDLAMLAERVRAAARRDGRGGVKIGRSTRKTLLRVIAARRKALRKAAMREGERLYRRSPKRFIAAIRTAYRCG